MRLSLMVGLILALLASGCRTVALDIACQSPLANRLTPEEEGVLKRLPDPDKVMSTHDIRTDLLWGGILEKDSLPPVLAAWNQHLAATYDSNVDLEAQALVLAWRPFIQALAEYNKTLEACKPKPADYDGSWADGMRKKFGSKLLKQHEKTLRYALADLRARAEVTCGGSSTSAVLVAELTYHTVLEDQLRQLKDFVHSTQVLSPQQKSALLHRADLYASALHKVSIARVMLASIELQRARSRAVAEKLPSDMATALKSQHLFSRPFDLVRAGEDLTRVLE